MVFHWRMGLAAALIFFSACSIKFTENGPHGGPSEITTIVPAKVVSYFQAGYGGRLVTSTDFRNWTQAAVPTGPSADNNFNFRGGCTDGSTVIFVGGGGPVDADHQWARKDVTWDYGKTWTETLENINWFGGCGYESRSGTFIAVGGQGVFSVSSDRGHSWTAQPRIIVDNSPWAFREIVCVPGSCLARADTGLAMIFDGGAIWTSGANPLGVSSLLVGKNNTFLGLTPDGQVATSANGLDWTIATGSPTGLRYLKYNGANYFGYAGNLTTVYQSPDALNWTAYPVTPSFSRIVNFGSQAIGVVGTGTALFSSTDDRTWNDLMMSDLAIGDTNVALAVEH